MTPEEFRASLALLGLTQQGFGRLAGISGRAVQLWAAGDRAIPGTVETLLGLLHERAVAPASLPPDSDRDEPCSEALDPHLDALAARAEAAGWHPAEVAAAVLGWATHRIADGAGQDAALEMLADAAEMVRMRGASS